MLHSESQSIKIAHQAGMVCYWHCVWLLPNQQPEHMSTTVHALFPCCTDRCVNLGTYEANKVVTFVPPDGEFELMRCGCVR